jgi:RNA polymerase sigma-B factor
MPSRSLSQRPGTTRPAIVTEILLRRYAVTHRSADLEELVRRHQPLARRIARRYRFSSVPRDDLEQAAYVGLLKAIRRFDPDRGFAFSTFAVPTIVGDVKRQCREAIWTTHVPRPVQERVALVRRAAGQLSAELARSPRVREIASRVGWNEERVLEALTAATALNTLPLDGGVGDADADAGSPAERIGCEDSGYELAECRATIEEALLDLTEDERTRSPRSRHSPRSLRSWRSRPARRHVCCGAP